MPSADKSADRFQIKNNLESETSIHENNNFKFYINYNNGNAFNATR